MRWQTAVFYFVILCSVNCEEVSDDDNGEPYLHVMARASVFNAGERRAIFCQGRNLEHAINWYSPSGNIIGERSTMNRVYVERKEDKNGIWVPLIIHEVKVEDAGIWTCKSGDYNDTIEIIVGIKVKIPNRHTTVEGDEGRNAKLQCEAKGYPLPVIQWYKNGDLITNENPGKYTMRKKGDTYSLEIKSLSYEDVGEYVCKVTQETLSYYTDKVINLSVKHAPVLQTFKTVEIYAVVNATKEINCSAIANPTPVYRWYRRHGNYDTDIREEDSITTAEDGSYSVLQLRIVNDEQFGGYVCKVSNNKGSNSVLFDISMGERPPAPDDAVMIGSNATHITFNVSCSACPVWQNDTIAQDPKNLSVIGFDFSLTPVVKDFPPDWDNEILFELEGTGPGVYEVGILPNKTTFHARVRTRNEAGVSDWTILSSNPTTANAMRLAATFLLVIAAYISTSY